MKRQQKEQELAGATDKNRKFALLLQEDIQARKPISPTGQVYLLPHFIQLLSNLICIVYLKKGDVCIRMRCWKKIVTT